MSQVPLSPELLDALHRLSSLLDGDDALQSTLDTVVELAVGTLRGCDGAGVTLQTDGDVRTAAASDDYTLEIDSIQYETGQGPCVEATRRGQFFQIESVSRETRWPEFCRRAADKGFGSNLSFPLRSDGWKGALNIYAKTESAFDERDLAIGQIYAAQASIALQNAQTYAAARALAAQLDEALSSRDIIGQAKGILMVREGVDEEEAFAMLVTVSQRSNVKLRDVAEKLVRDHRSVPQT